MRPWLLVGLVTAGCMAHVEEPLPSPTVDELLAVYGSTCGGYEGLYDCSPPRFELTFARELPAMRRHRRQLVAHWMESVRAGGDAAAYGLAWANVREALPYLREGLLADRYFYGWESSDAHELSARMRDDQYPRHLARILAIEALSGRPLAEAVALTPRERAQLVQESLEDSEPGSASDVARWLLSKLAPEAPSEDARPWAVRFVRACSEWSASVTFATPSHVFGCRHAIFERESGALVDVRPDRVVALARLGETAIFWHDDALLIRGAGLQDIRVPLSLRPEWVLPRPDGRTLLLQSAGQLDVLEPSTRTLRRIDGGEACSSSVGPLGFSRSGAVQCIAREREDDHERSVLRTLGGGDDVELPPTSLAVWVPSGERFLAWGAGVARWIGDDGEILATRPVDGGWSFLDVSPDGAMLIGREGLTEIWTFTHGEARVEPVYERRAEAGAFAGDEVVLSAAQSLVWLHRGEPGTLPSLPEPTPPADMRVLRPDADRGAATFEGGGDTYNRRPDDVAAFASDGPHRAYVVVSRSDAAELSRFASDDEGWARMVVARYVDSGAQQWAKHWRSDEGRVLRAHVYIGGCERDHIDVLVRERHGVLERWTVHTDDGEALEPILGAIPDAARDVRLLREDTYTGDPSIGELP